MNTVQIIDSKNMNVVQGFFGKVKFPVANVPVAGPIGTN